MNTVIKHMRYESIQDPLDEEERELMDPETWDWDHAEVFPGNVRASFEISPRFSLEDYNAIVALADQEDVTPAELVQRIVLEFLNTKHQKTMAGSIASA